MPDGITEKKQTKKKCVCELAHAASVVCPDVFSGQGNVTAKIPLEHGGVKHNGALYVC